MAAATNTVHRMMTSQPLNDIRDLLQRLPEANEVALDDFHKRQASRGAEDLGGFESLGAWLAQWSGKARPDVRRPLVAIFAGAHGIAAHGVSTRPASWTQNAVDACAAGEAPTSRLCREFDFSLKVFDLALDLPTSDFTVAAALDERACAATMAFGMEALADGTDLLCLGGFGVGGSTVAAAVMATLQGGVAAEWCLPSSAMIDARRETVVTNALVHHRQDLDDPLEVLRRLGGRELAALAGAILAARFQNVPVILDGPSALAAAALVHRARPGAAAHCLMAAPLRLAAYGKATGEMGMSAVLGASNGARSQHPIDGVLAMARLKAAVAVTG